jgi:hypothetical protein
VLTEPETGKIGGRVMKKLTHPILSSVLVIAWVAFAYAQNMPVLTPPPTQSQQRTGVRGVADPQERGFVVHGVGGDMGFQFVGAEPTVSGHVVKGAPYSLEATVETEQTLADGNRIGHHHVVLVYRDSEGRTRREETLAALGPWAASGTPPTVVTIQDPVSGVTYSLDPQTKIAIKLPTGSLDPQNAIKLPTGSAGTITISRGNHTSGIESGIPVAPPDGPQTIMGVGGMFVVQEGIASQPVRPDERSESLGKETIAGVSAEGVRLTTTIPAEAMGNERPIEITRERWFSPELQIVLRSKQDDPRFGVTTYEVTKLDRATPAHSLFQVPRDYQIRKAPEPPPPPPK